MIDELLPLCIFAIVAVIAYVIFVFATASSNKALRRFAGGGIMREVAENEQDKKYVKGDAPGAISLECLSQDEQYQLLRRYGVIQ